MALCGLGGTALAQAQASGSGAGTETRLALLLGNRNYPSPFDLPPILKNVHDMHSALVSRGFEVSDGLDLDPERSRQMLEAFIVRARAAPPDAVIFFYFSGHGVQIDAANLLIAAGVSPAARSDTIQKGSLQLLVDVVGRLPERPRGITIAVVDACRTTLKAATDADGLNQVEAPPGCLIAFSTGAGRPAIAPAVETINTFYTGSLVKLLVQLPGEVSFSDMFRLVKADVERTMSTHPVEAIRKLAQKPFIAENARQRVALAPAVATAEAAGGGVKFSDPVEESDWARLEASFWPAEVVQLAEAFLAAHPKSKYASSAQVARDGAEDGVHVLQRTDVRLYRGAFQLRDDAGPDARHDLYRASRGDKDAAARHGRRTLKEAGGPAAISRYEGWLQYAAALGNGIASYELALHFRGREQPLLASQFESRARELGYNPPPTLDNVRK